jgi:hypothetical protein
MTSPIRLQLQQWLVIADTIPISNTIPLNHRQVVGKAIALPYIGRHCLPIDKHQFMGQRWRVFAAATGVFA